MTVTQAGTPASPAVASGSNSMSVTGSFGTGQNASNDLQVALVSAFGASSSTVPTTSTSGWTQILSIQATTVSIAIWTAKGAATAPVFTSTGSGTASHARITCEIISLHDSGGKTPVLDVSGTGTGTTTSLTVTTSANVSGSGEYALSVFCEGGTSNGTGTYTKGSAWTAITDTFSTTGYAHSAFDELSSPSSGSTLSEASSWTATTAHAAGIVAVFAPPPAWTVLQSCSALNASGSTITATFTTANLSAGTKLVAYVQGEQAAGTAFGLASVKDSNGNSLTQKSATPQGAGGGYTTNLWVFALDTPAGDVGTKPGVTVTWNGAGASTVAGAILVQEISGLAPEASSLDGTPGTGAASNTSQPSTPSYSSTASGEFLFNVLCAGGGTGPSSTPSGYTLDPNTVNDASAGYLGVAYKSSTNGAETGSWAFATGPNWAIALGAFLLASASTASAQVSQAVPQPARKPARIPPQVITGVLANASSADSGTGAGGVAKITVIPSAQDTGHGSGLPGSLNTGAVVAAIRGPVQPPGPRFPVQKPQVITGTLADAFSADSGHGTGAGSQVTVVPATQASGHGSGGVTQITVIPATQDTGHGTAAVLAAGQLSEAVTRAVPQPGKPPVPQAKPQVVTGFVPGTVNVSSSDSGTGHGAVADIGVTPATQASGHGAGAPGSLNTGAVVEAVVAAPAHPVKPFRAPPQVIFNGALSQLAVNGADSAVGAAGVPVIRPQAAGTADSGHGSAQGAVRPEAAGTGHGAGAVTSIKPEAAGTGSGHGSSTTGVSSADSGHGAGQAGSIDTGAVVAAIQAIQRPVKPFRAPPQVITGLSSTHAVSSADYGRGIGSDFFFIISPDSAVGAGQGVIHVSAAAAGHGAGASLSRWLASADTGHAAAGALSRWPVSADTGHGTGRALSAWPSSADTGHGSGAVPHVALTVDAAATGHGTDAYGDLGIWTLLPPSWSERRGLVWITARLEDGGTLELVRGLPPSRELLELARMVSSSTVRHVKAADSGRGSGGAHEVAPVTVWVTEAVRVSVQLIGEDGYRLA